MKTSIIIFLIIFVCAISLAVTGFLYLFTTQNIVVAVVALIILSNKYTRKALFAGIIIMSICYIAKFLMH